jgi:hypothetical protein
MTRTETHQHFVSRFCADGADPIAREDLDRAEDRLGILFPSAYREFVLTRGAAHSHTLLGLIVDAEADLWDVTSFHKPSECVEATETYRSAGMSARLVAFASDSAGNVFCFDERELFNARLDDATVWFFDHDFNEDKQLAESFDAWLSSYFSLP